MKVLETISAAELSQMQIEKPQFIVDGLLPAGLAILVAPPKYGKSFLCVDLAISVSNGSNFLGFQTNQSGVLYLSLEDSNGRLQDRLKAVANGRKFSPELNTCIYAPRLDEGLLASLKDYISKHENARLIIIDTLQKIRGEMSKNQSAYGEDYRSIGDLKRFADANKICILLVHHCKKMKDNADTFNNISGTSGIFGACDTALVMDKEKRTSEVTRLSVVGRDIEMAEFSMTFDKTICRWRIQGRNDEIEQRKILENPLRLTILEMMRQNPKGWSGSASDIIANGEAYGSPISVPPTKIGSQITKMRETLLQDGISYEVVSNGTGAKKHRFCYV